MAAPLQHRDTDHTAADIHRHLETQRERERQSAGRFPRALSLCRLGCGVKCTCWDERDRRAFGGRAGMPLLLQIATAQRRNESPSGSRGSRAQQTEPSKDSRQLVPSLRLPHASVSPQRKAAVLPASRAGCSLALGAQHVPNQGACPGHRVGAGASQGFLLCQGLWWLVPALAALPHPGHCLHCQSRHWAQHRPPVGRRRDRLRHGSPSLHHRAEEATSPGVGPAPACSIQMGNPAATCY